LESGILSEVTGLPATSAADILAGAVARFPTSVEGRRLQLRSVLRRMNDRTEPGSIMVAVFPESKPDYKIELRRQANHVLVSLSDPVTRTLDASIREEIAILEQPIDASNIDQVAIILDAALIVSARVPINYGLAVEYHTAPPPNIYDGTRLVWTDNEGKLNFEVEATVRNEGVSYQVRNYYKFDGQRIDPPTNDRIEVSANAYRHSHLYSDYYGPRFDSIDRTWCAFSTDAYRDSLIRAPPLSVGSLEMGALRISSYGY
jgi:hypothetical protein